MKDTIADFDVVIVGAGPGGLSAALWCADLGLSAVLIESEAEIGGQLLRTHNPILNYPGLIVQNGRELRDRIVLQAESAGMLIKPRSTAVRIDTKKKCVMLANGESITGRSLIVATGVRRRLLGVPGEKEFLGRGVIESGVRESSTVAGMVVAVIGGGDAGLENSLILSKTAKHVYIVHRGNQFKARESFVNLVQSAGNIKTLMNTRVKAISGGERVQSVAVEHLDTGESSFLQVNFVLVRIGVEPNSEKVRSQLGVDRNGYILIDSKCETSIEGIYAVGDVANPISPTISSAVGMGATAAKAVWQFVGTPISE